MFQKPIVKNLHIIDIFPIKEMCFLKKSQVSRKVYWTQGTVTKRWPSISSRDKPNIKATCSNQKSFYKCQQLENRAIGLLNSLIRQSAVSDFTATPAYLSTHYQLDDGIFSSTFQKSANFKCKKINFVVNFSLNKVQLLRIIVQDLTL